MVTIIITIKFFHLFISALCAAVFLDSVNLTETFPVSHSLFKLLPHTHNTVKVYTAKRNSSSQSRQSCLALMIS